MKMGSFTWDRLTIVLEIIFICEKWSVTCVETAALFPKPRKRQNGYYWENRQKSLSEAHEHDRSLSYKDFLEYNNSLIDNGNKMIMKNRRSNRGNQTTRSFNRNYDRSVGMMRILTFPLKNNDNTINGINDFSPGDPAGDCLAGGVDAGVVDGALKIGIGLGLAPDCEKGLRNQETPKMVAVPVPIPMPFGILQPYPVAINVPRPVAIPVPQPIPFPTFDVGPVAPSMQRFLSRLMTGRSW